MRKENFRGFAGAFAIRIAFVAPVLAAMAATQSRSAEPSSTQGAAEKESKVGDDSAADPELIALAWQYGSQANRKRGKQPVWRPDPDRRVRDQGFVAAERLGNAPREQTA